MILNVEKIFLLKKAKNKGAESLYEKYRAIVERTGVPTDEESIEYLKLFVQYDYKECTHIIRSRLNKNLTLYPYEKEYLHLVQLISAYYLDRADFIKGLLWAMKAIELCRLFYPTMDIYQRHELLNGLSASEFYHEFYPKYPIQELYDTFYLDWEIKSGLHLDYAFALNDN